MSHILDRFCRPQGCGPLASQVCGAGCYATDYTLDTSQKLDSVQVLHPFLKFSKLALNIETLEDMILTETGKLFQNGKTRSVMKDLLNFLITLMLSHLASLDVNLAKRSTLHFIVHSSLGY